MSEPRKFYRNVVSIVVLTEDEPWNGELAWLNYDITEGECVGYDFQVDTEEVTAGRMVTLLEDAGSDAGFFELDEQPAPMHDVDGFDITEG